MSESNRKALFPGSFDPFTLGHISVIDKALNLFDEVVIGVGHNSSKSGYFDIDKRASWIETIYAQIAAVSVVVYSDLTVNFAEEQNCMYLVRGLRNPSDFQYESNIAHMNAELNPSIQTVFLLCDPKFAAINSSIVREIHRNGGDISGFVPEEINRAIIADR